MLVFSIAFLRDRHVREVVPEVEWPDDVAEGADTEAEEDNDDPPVAFPSAEVETEPRTSAAAVARLPTEEVLLGPFDVPEDEISPAGDGPDTVEPTDRDRPTELLCEVVFWRGYWKAAFYARACGDEEDLAVAESPFFRTRAQGDPEPTDQATAAHKALCDQLVRDSWERVGNGNAWYSATFRRDLMVAAGGELERTPP